MNVPLRGGFDFPVHRLLLGAPTGELASIASLRGLLCCTLPAFAFTPSRTHPFRRERSCDAKLVL